MSGQLELFGPGPWCQRWREQAETWQLDDGERFTGRGYTVEPIAQCRRGGPQ